MDLWIGYSLRDRRVNTSGSLFGVIRFQGKVPALATRPVRFMGETKCSPGSVDIHLMFAKLPPWG